MGSVPRGSPESRQTPLSRCRRFWTRYAVDSRQGYAEPLKEYIASGKPYMGICIGLQTLFEGSEEAPGVQGLGVVPGIVSAFSPEEEGEGGVKGKKSVPQMGGIRPKW